MFLCVRPILAVAPLKTAATSAYRIDSKKYYAPENTNVGLDPTGRNVWYTDDGRTKIRPEKCLTRTKPTSTGPIRLGTAGMR